MPRIALRMVDFPDPDSPTIPRVELSDKENETSLTASNLSSLWKREASLTW